MKKVTFATNLHINPVLAAVVTFDHYDEDYYLRQTLNSLVDQETEKPLVDAIVVYDVGNSANVKLDLIKWGVEYGVKLYYKLDGDGETTNFITVFNNALKFADAQPRLDYLLLMRTGDTYPDDQDDIRPVISDQTLISHEYGPLILTKAHNNYRLVLKKYKS